MSTKDHKAEAARVLAAAHEVIAKTAALGQLPIERVASFNANVSRDLAIAQVHATLALVEEQRTANKIAKLRLDGGRGVSLASAYVEIEERLS